MLKILVPTDLGRESRAGMRFAIRWAAQQKATLLFFHAAYIPSPTRWSEKKYNAIRLAELDLRQRKMNQFVAGVYARMGIPAQQYECLVVEGISPEVTLQDYCREHPDIDLICMSTHGASGIQRLWGTHTGNMITHSPIPVIAVPKGYRAAPLTSLLYASDLTNYEQELKKVVPLVHQLQAELHVLHLIAPDETVPAPQLFQKIVKQEFHQECHVHFDMLNETRSVAANLDKRIQDIKPSLVVMFTDQQRRLFEKIFFPSQAESYAFRGHTPLLVFPKTKKAG